VLEESENLGIREIEKILSTEIGDWIRWGRNKDYLPVSFRCPLGFLYIPKRGDIETALYSKPKPINMLAVVEFERIVIRLPEKHRQAFVMYHLNRAKVKTRIVEKKRSGYDMGKILGVSKSKFYGLVSEAHNMVFRNWKGR
jgi:hypothetical protein